HAAAGVLAGVSPLTGTYLIYVVALVLEVFISSGSAKAFLLMPIILPIADLIGVTRQVAVTAYCLGDGFANMAYPTNAMLLISLGLTAVSYPKWIRWTAALWGQIVVVSLIFLAIAVGINYGPF
ncbi:MAG: AbgT family transporter, partial [Anaerolineae bacterium]|nr:AbgT family transporter [Anaerolineae bacterium]